MRYIRWTSSSAQRPLDGHAPDQSKRTSPGQGQRRPRQSVGELSTPSILDAPASENLRNVRMALRLECEQATLAQVHRAVGVVGIGRRTIRESPDHVGRAVVSSISRSHRSASLLSILGRRRGPSHILRLARSSLVRSMRVPSSSSSRETRRRGRLRSTERSRTRGRRLSVACPHVLRAQQGRGVQVPSGHLEAIAGRPSEHQRKARQRDPPARSPRAAGAWGGCDWLAFDRFGRRRPGRELVCPRARLPYSCPWNVAPSSRPPSAPRALASFGALPFETLPPRPPARRASSSHARRRRPRRSSASSSPKHAPLAHKLRGRRPIVGRRESQTRHVRDRGLDLELVEGCKRRCKRSRFLPRAPRPPLRCWSLFRGEPRGLEPPTYGLKVRSSTD